MRNPTKPMSDRFEHDDNDLAYLYRRRIGKSLRALREQADMTQAQLAHQLDIGPSAVAGMESGRVGVAPERYEEIASLFGLDRQQFGKFLLRYTNPWMYALIYGHDAIALKYDLDAIPERIGRPEVVAPVKPSTERPTDIRAIFAEHAARQDAAYRAKSQRQ